MKALKVSFVQFCTQIFRDGMLAMIALSPLLLGAAYKIGLPPLEAEIGRYYGEPLLLPYYPLMDLILAALAPYMFCFASALVILEERDTGISKYLAVTPLGKSGYLLSRLGIPAAFSALFSTVLLGFFTLSGLSFLKGALLSFFTASAGLVSALLIAAFSANKVEGVALGKISNLMLAGILVPFFFTGPEQYWALFLPSFWTAKLMLQTNPINFFGASLSTFIWVLALYGPFKRKII